MTSTLLVLVLLSQAEQPVPSSAGAVPPLAASTVGGWRYLTRLEATVLTPLPSSEGGEAERYAQLTPMLAVDGGEAFGLNPGAPVRLRLGGGGWSAVAGVGADALSPTLDMKLRLDSGQVRWRFRRTLYALAEGGTLLCPQAGGALRPGAYASLGLGVDNAR